VPFLNRRQSIGFSLVPEPHLEEHPASVIAEEKQILATVSTRLQPRPGETWKRYRIRLRRAQIAADWWRMNEAWDAAKGLPPDPEPDWEDDANLDRWDHPPWMSRSDVAAIRAGEPLPGSVAVPSAAGLAAPELPNPLAERLGAWERATAALPPPPQVRSIEDILAAAESLPTPPPAAPTSPTVTGGGAGDISASTVIKFVKAGAKLFLKNDHVLVKAGAKVIPIANFAYYAAKLHDEVFAGVGDAAQQTYLPTRNYQQYTNSFIYTWPDGTVTAAPRP
jgi:hypothetical protein